MHLRKLSLLNFKNYPEAELTFDPGANAFVGGNGEGKTNLLDAIHYLSMSKSYLHAIDGYSILHGEDFFMIQGVFQNEGREDTIYCGLKRNQKKVFKINQKEYERLADHIGLLPVVMISPADSNLITEGSDQRRKFLDSIISQYDRIYLEHLLRYNRVVSQRNSYLRLAGHSGTFDSDSLSVWDDQMIQLGEMIHRVRKQFLAELNPIFRKYYEFISNGKESVDIRYESQLDKGDFEMLLKAAREKDRTLQYSTAGIHKDDLLFQIAAHPVKRFASQGQQKSFLIALKLAHFDFISGIKKVKPILLLDDIFDKLDDFRVSRLMELVSQDNFGQLFITDTHAERIRKIFADIGVTLRCLLVKDKTIISEETRSMQDAELRMQN